MSQVPFSSRYLLLCNEIPFVSIAFSVLCPPQRQEQALLIYGVPETYTVPDTLRMLNQYLLNWFYIELWIKPIWNIGMCIEVGCRHRSELWPLGSPRVALGKSLNLLTLVSLVAKEGTLILYLANLLWCRRRGNSPATSPEFLWLV